MKPARLIEILSEILVLALGALLAYLALGRLFVMPSGHALTTVLGALLIIWGLRTWVRRKQATQASAKLLQWLRSISLVVAGTVMLLVAWTPLGNPQLMLATVGAVLAVRGFFGAILAALVKHE